MAYQSINPFNGLIAKAFDEITDKHLEVKLAAAHACYQQWKQQSYAERGIIISKVAALMRQKAEFLARTLTLDMGKRINEARGEVESQAVLHGIGIASGFHGQSARHQQANL